MNFEILKKNFSNRGIQIRSGPTSGSDVGSFFFQDPISSSQSREDVHLTPDVGRPTEVFPGLPGDSKSWDGTGNDGKRDRMGRENRKR
jgi:hypothetical protein